MQRYNPKDIEPRWQKIWSDDKVYEADLNSSKPKYVAMSMFNYPSGAGIHIGHAMNYTISDVKARFKRQQGYESYHPVGWDSFGLPAENYAIKAGVSPQESMSQIIPSYHKQYKAMGWSNDWSKEIATHEPDYYRWTQWIFSQMYKQGLAYQASRMQWWCTKCQTVLANEQVIDGKCWRHDSPEDIEVQKKEVKQWFFKITEYADEMLEAIEDLDWTESVKLAQKNWIGRSQGAEIKFKVESEKSKVVEVFTTRPDTLFGATFLVLAPEHPLVSELTVESEKSKVERYVKESMVKTDVERQETNREKTGVFTGAYATNPVNNNKIPVWVADYVLPGYGTGAIMAVPAHDERDYEFSKKFELPMQYVVEPVTGEKQGDEVEKDAIVAIVRNPKTGEVLMLDWGPRKDRFGGSLFIGGGVEGDEDIVLCAEREIAEETGYNKLKHVATLPFVTHSYYFSNVKNKNYYAKMRGLLFDLESNEQVETNLDEGEKDKFKLKWVSVGEAERLVDDDGHRYIFEALLKDTCFHGEGVMINSGDFSGQSSSDARENIIKVLADQGTATEKVNYKMRDWSVSRQRYWGAPIPIVNCQNCGPVLVPDESLPVVLPVLEDFQPSGDGRSALARATDWLKATCPTCGGEAERETDTLDTYICSSWYMYRYFDPANSEQIFDSQIAKKWEPIDFYNGADHATAHLLYARFIARFFTKLGLVNNPEPFKQFLFNGKVTAGDGTMFSKSKGNGVDPLEIIEQGYGADALRTYLMFAAPLEVWVKWDPQGVPGTHRFLSRIWTLVKEYVESDDQEMPAEQQRAIQAVTHAMIKKMTHDIEANRYNTAIAAAMGCLNELYKQKVVGLGKNDTWQQALETMVCCVAPFAPHIADELWHELGHTDTVHIDHWPKWDEQYLVADTLTLAVQINGKLRGEITVASDTDEATITAAAAANEKVAGYLSNQTIKKTIYVKGKLVSFVV